MTPFTSRWVYGDSLCSNIGYWWFNGRHYLSSCPYEPAAKRFVSPSNARDWIVYCHEQFQRSIHA